MYQNNKGVSKNIYSNSKHNLEEVGLPREGVELVPSDVEGENTNEDRSNPFLQPKYNNEDNSNTNFVSSEMVSGEFNRNKGQEEGEEDPNYNSSNNYNLNYNYSNNQEGEDPNNSMNIQTKYEEINNYKEMLEQKVRKQAKRLCELQEYKSLCEKRISQLSPGHSLPVLDSHVVNGEKNINKTSHTQDIQFNNVLQSYKFQIQELTNKLLNRENEYSALQKRYQQLENKYNKYVDQSVPKSLLNNFNHMISFNQENVFPSPERLPNERMRDAYTKMFLAYKELMREKENILNSLRQETINNDEQRNLIEILKQTIESNLVKHGLHPLIEKQKSLHYKSSNMKDVTDVEVLVDIVQLKNEADRVKKELIHYDVLVNELKHEIEFLRETNNEMNSKKEKIKQSLENGIKELEEAKEKVKALESEKFYLSDELNELREYNETILKEYETTLEKNVYLEKDLEELHLQGNDQTLLENKLAEYKSNFEKMSQELEKILQEKETLEIKSNQQNEENKKLKENTESLSNEVDTFKNNNKDLGEKLNSLQKSTEKLNSKNNELNANLNNSLKLLSETERNYNNLESEFNKLKPDFNDLEEKYSSLDSNYQSALKEKEAISIEAKQLKSENLQILVENNKMKVETNDFSNNFNKIFQQYETINKNYKNLELLYSSCKMEKENLFKELTLIKEKTGNEEYNKTKEMSRLNSQLTMLKAEKSDMENFFNSEISRLKEEMDKNILERNESEKLMRRDFSNLKINYEELIKGKNFIDIEIMENKKYIQSLEDEMSRREKAKVNSSSMEGAFHEVKLAIHSCLSVASVFMQKYNNTYNKGLDESFSNFNNNMNSQMMLDSLRNLEEWLNVICKELETCYSRIQVSAESKNYSYNQESVMKLQQLTEDYNNLYKSNEKLQKELRSYKNDNKKLYDQYKKYQEDMVKNILIQNESKFLESILIKILNSLPNKETVKIYKEIINLNNNILTSENDKIKIQKRIDAIEKEMQRNIPNKNVELEKNVLKEIENLRGIISDYEIRINENREQIFFLEKEIKAMEEKTSKETGGLNVFKANYMDKNSGTIGKNKEYDSRKFYRNSDMKKLSENSRENLDYEQFNDVNSNNREANYQMNPSSTSYYKRVREGNQFNTQGI